jgi:phage terminase small subunit
MMGMAEDEVKPVRRKKPENPKTRRHNPMLSGRAERFCLLVASGKSHKAAWIGAGFSPTNYMFAMGRMLKRADIQDRIASHMAVTAIKFEITVENVYHRLDRAYHGAMKKSDFASAVAASMGIAKIGGLLIDKINVEHQVVVRPARDPTPKDIELSIEEWREKFRPKLLGGNGSEPAG